MADKNRLQTYHGKRDFSRIPEPRGTRKDGTEKPHFVVQIHDASTMHFDFRLQVGDVLKSWSIPKGPSTDPKDKRLAVPTEDHPLEYEDFEGVIAEGEYGGGTVIVWERGTYRPQSHDRRGRPVPFDESLERGHATFWLDGSKLRGEYALTRFRDGKTGGKKRGLAPGEGQRRTGRCRPRDARSRRARSARSGRTLRQLAAQGAEQA
jgi:DNA ligase D-like protein (predicted 3'-phosphoesterase)